MIAVFRIVHREANVGATHRGEHIRRGRRPACRDRRDDGVGETIESLRGKRGQQPRFVAEMMCGGRMRHARAARDFAHRDERRSLLADDAADAVEERGAKVAMMIVVAHTRRHGLRHGTGLYPTVTHGIS